ncbi:MAG: sulfatase-like hydrolase/transferase, partial [Chloroflexota bacterium]
PWSEWQKMLALCYAQITLVDEAGGRILAKLDELGLAENTLVIWTADHGDALACHGGHFNKRCYLPEEVMRVPLAIRWPGKRLIPLLATST